MKLVKLYNVLVLPYTTIYLKDDYAKNLDGTNLLKGDDITIILSYEENQISLNKDNLFEFGVVGKVIDIKDRRAFNAA